MEKLYIVTEQKTQITLPPHKINNNIYENIKNKLRDNMEKRCNTEGYLSEIYEIEKYKKNMVKMDDLTCSVTFNVVFNCRMCVPRKQQQIICIVEESNQMLIKATNGPIIVIIPSDSINSDKFMIDRMGRIRYKIKKSGDSKSVDKGDYIFATLTGVQISLKSQYIYACAKLDDMYYGEISEENYESV